VLVGICFCSFLVDVLRQGHPALICNGGGGTQDSLETADIRFATSSRHTLATRRLVFVKTCETTVLHHRIMNGYYRGYITDWDVETVISVLWRMGENSEREIKGK
jgi:hypothetical protein